MRSTSQLYQAEQQFLGERTRGHASDERWPIPQAVLFIGCSAAACWAVLIMFVMLLFG